MSTGEAEKTDEGTTFNPNVRPSEPYSKRVVGPLFEPKEPMINRLAEAARPKKEQPIAGWVGIQRLKEPEVDVPAECMLYENDYFKFQLSERPKNLNLEEKVKDQKDLEVGLEALAASTFKEALNLAEEQRQVKQEVTPTATKGKGKSKEAQGKKGVAIKEDIPHRQSYE